MSYSYNLLFICRTAVKAVVERLGHSAFYTTARSLFEQDRPLFALLTALEVFMKSIHIDTLPPRFCS